MISAAADAAECSIVTSPRPFDRFNRRTMFEMAFAKNKTKPSAEIFLHNEAIEIFCFDAARCDLWKNEELVETNVLTLSFLVAKMLFRDSKTLAFMASASEFISASLVLVQASCFPIEIPLMMARFRSLKEEHWTQMKRETIELLYNSYCNLIIVLSSHWQKEDLTRPDVNKFSMLGCE